MKIIEEIIINKNKIEIMFISDFEKKKYAKGKIELIISDILKYLNFKLFWSIAINWKIINTNTPSRSENVIKANKLKIFRLKILNISNEIFESIIKFCSKLWIKKKLA